MDEQLLAVNQALVTLLGHSNFKLSDVSRISLSRIKEIFRDRAKVVHPDRAIVLGKSREFLEHQFRAINDAYQFITNEVKESQAKSNFLRNRNTRRAPQQESYSYSKSNGAGNFFYNGRLPEKELRFAEFLYYSRLINWKTLINSLTWQGKNRPRTGEIAQSYGFFTKDDLLEIIRNSLLHEKLGQTAMRMNIMSPEQLRRVLIKQRSYRLPIGKYFTEHRLIEQYIIEQKLKENMVHNLKFRQL